MKIDYLIVGQGIAGTVLSYELRKAGCRVQVIENNKRKGSSKVAAGIFNPITGRKLVKTWYGDTLFPALHTFYPEFEEFLATKFFHPKDVYVPFDSQEKQNNWMVQAADPAYESYINGFKNDLYSDAIHAPFGGMCITKSGYVAIPEMLETYRKHLLKNDLLIEQEFDYESVKLLENSIQWRHIEAAKLIFCDGVESAFNNPFFKWLAFKPVKGELLKVKFEHTEFKHIINRGCWILPQKDGTCKVGATYDNHDLSENITENARVKLLEKLEMLSPVKYKVLEQLTGIRPATYDRRPFIGLHPLYKNIAIFNGLGAKGISLAPYFAKHFSQVLLNGETLMGLVDINRVIRKYAIKNEVLAKL